MCLAADVPLVESGTAGYLGQATVIKKVWLYPTFSSTDSKVRTSLEGRINSIITKYCWRGFIVEVTCPGFIHRLKSNKICVYLIFL